MSYIAYQKKNMCDLEVRKTFRLLKIAQAPSQKSNGPSLLSLGTRTFTCRTGTWAQSNTVELMLKQTGLKQDIEKFREENQIKILYRYTRRDFWLTGWHETRTANNDNLSLFIRGKKIQLSPLIRVEAAKFPPWQLSYTLKYKNIFY